MKLHFTHNGKTYDAPIHSVQIKTLSKQLHITLQAEAKVNGERIESYTDIVLDRETQVAQIIEKFLN